MSSQLTLKFNFQFRREPDLVWVSLRSGTAPYDLVEAVYGTGGGNADAAFRFEKASDGVPYYIVVSSGNALETWSAMTVTFSAGAASYDFTTSTDQAYGGNQTLSADGIPSIYQGDVNIDGSIDIRDLAMMTHDQGDYLHDINTDLDGDRDVDDDDLRGTSQNMQKHIMVMRP